MRRVLTTLQHRLSFFDVLYAGCTRSSRLVGCPSGILCVEKDFRLWGYCRLAKLASGRENAYQTAVSYFLYAFVSQLIVGYVVR